MCIIIPQCDINMCSVCTDIFMFVIIAMHVHMCLCVGEMEVNVSTLHRHVLRCSTTIFRIHHIFIFLQRKFVVFLKT